MDFHPISSELAQYVVWTDKVAHADAHELDVAICQHCANPRHAFRISLYVHLTVGIGIVSRNVVGHSEEEFGVAP